MIFHMYDLIYRTPYYREVWKIMTTPAQREANARMLAKRQDHVRTLKEAYPCIDCGLYYPHWIMQYDHLDPSTKEADISKLVSSGSIKRIDEEISKCDLVCANCHITRTWIRAHPSIITHTLVDLPYLSTSMPHPAW